MTKVKPGMFIGERYEILALIGSGGTADVFKAVDRRLNRNVAIKILKSSFTGDKKIVEKFRQEAQSCAGLTHPNIVSVYDVGNDGDLHYIVMELIEGITLKKFIERKGKLEIKEAIGIAIQIAQGLDAAHANHIVHRDIKPQNIIISREGKVKVTDFGIARATLGTSTNTINQAPVGSVHYLSPEQARGGFSDERSDIYSLGVTIYEMLSGKVPFSGDNNVSVALLHIQGEATPLHELNPDVTPSVEKIVAKCMQKKPERRYFSAAELIKDLKASINNPTGNFVKLGKASVSNSPTKEMSPEEIKAIKSQAHTGDALPDDEEDYDEEEEYDYDEESEMMDDEELDTVNTKTEKLIIIGSIMLVVILLGFVIFLFSKLNVFSGSKGSESSAVQESNNRLSDTQIKRFIASYTTLDEMEEALQKENVKYDLQGKYRDDIEKDKIITMYYPIESDTDVLIVEFSLGKQPANTKLMISVVGKDSNEARNILTEWAKPAVAVVRTKAASEHSDEPQNQVISQSIEDGEAVPIEEGKKIEILLVYSIGPEELTVPNLASETSVYDRQSIENLYGEKYNFEFAFDFENSQKQPGICVKTEPAAGEPISVGDKIVVYLSSETVKVPEVTGMTKSEAQAKLSAIGLQVAVTDVEEGEGKPGDVIKQSKEKGDIVARGSVIYLTAIKVPDTPTPTPEGWKPTDTPTPTPEATDTPTPTPEPVATDTPTPVPTDTPTPDPGTETNPGGDTKPEG
ncbi:MAG: Stk1 family PASTA domain-containing Ser/Thr kinase [Lachnospiraceae bacterium]|nr:Stk1 family PASTA domain-containing Ser/Thr kinase [Lachnospiraceae bacterium]